MRYKKQIDQVRHAYNAYLTTTPRYARFMDSESLEEWIFLLGRDVLLLTHADETASITQRFIAANKHDLSISIEEKEQLLLAAWIHDWGEIIIDGEGVGDVTFERKTDADQTIETTILNKIIHNFQPEEIKEAFHITYQDVVLKKNPKLGECFNVIERIGYLETAITAYQGKKGKRIKNWQGLTGNVLSNQIRNLLAYSEKYSFVKSVLLGNQEIITTAFLAIKDIPVPIDKERNLSYDSKKLAAAYSEYFKNTTLQQEV